MSTKMSSRSRQGSETTIRSHWSRPSARRISTASRGDDDDMAGSPENGGHRKRRTGPLQERKKESKSDAKKLQQFRTKSRSSKTGNERSRRSVQSKTSSRSAGTHDSRSKDGDDMHILDPEGTSARSASPRRQSGSHRRRSSPAALDLLVTPEDSISQVGPNPRTTRPSTRRRSAYTKLGRIAEDEADEQDFAAAPQYAYTKRQSIFGALFGRQRRADDGPTRDVTRIDHSPQDSRRRSSYTDEIDARRGHERYDEELARRTRSMDLNRRDEKQQSQRRAEAETWGVGNAAGHLMNDDFVHVTSKVAMSSFGDARMGRRGERASGRRRRPKMDDGVNDSGLAANFLGDQSVLGFGPFAPRASRHSLR